MYAHVFENPIVEAPVKESVKKESVKEAKQVKEEGKTKQKDDSKKFCKEISALNYGLRQREKVLAERAEVSQRPVAAFKRGNTTTFSSLSSIFGDIDNEIERELRKTKWPRLVDSYKMKFIKVYIDELTSIGKTDKSAVVRQLKDKNKYRDLENVSYDMELMKVSNLGETFTLANGRVIEL